VDLVQATQPLGTIPWMAPEFLDQKIFSTQSDIYSFGIFMYEVFYCNKAMSNPYGDLQGVQIMYQVIN